MILSFAFDLRAEEEPYKIYPLLQVPVNEWWLKCEVADRLGCERDEVGIETIEGEDALILMGNYAPPGKVIDINNLFWYPSLEEFTYEYVDAPV